MGGGLSRLRESTRPGGVDLTIEVRLARVFESIRGVGLARGLESGVGVG